MKRNMLNANQANLLIGSVIFLLGTCVAVFSCLYFCFEINIPAYRLVAIFISLIFVSNLGAKLLFNYFEHKT